MRSSLAAAIVLCASLLACDKLLHRHADGGVDAGDTTAAVDAAPAPTVADTADAAPEAAATPTATHAAAAIAPGAIPVGTFVGTVHEGSLPAYSMTVTLNAGGGAVSYGPPFGCTGAWTLTSHEGGAFHYKEKITKQGTAAGERRCADNETATLTEIKPGTSYTYAEGSAHAVVSKH